MTNVVMMKLGNFQFSLPTAAYQELEERHAWRWNKQGRLGRKPAHQYVGPDSGTIDMSGTIYPHFRGGLGQIKTLKAEGDKGEPLLMVDGFGKDWGKYCMLELSSKKTFFLANGIARKIEFSISLIEYGKDE